MVAPSLHRILYVSRLAPGLGYDTFTSICRSARNHNARHGIAGVLLFDGQRFCQELRGPREAIDALMDRIARDPRHEQLAVLVDAPVDDPAPPSWRAGYCEPNALDPLDTPDPPGHEAADAIFRALLEIADLS
jgi:hypothetical protein